MTQTLRADILLSEAPAPEVPRKRVPIWLALVAASLPMFMSTLDNLVMNNALPAIAIDLSATVEELQWFINSYTLAFATFILMAVALGDRLGRRTVFLAGIALFTAGSIYSALSVESWMLILGRAVQGVGAGAIMPLSLTLLVGSVQPRLRALAIGIWGGISGLGVALGPLVGGAVTEGLNWQAIFWINVPVGFIAVPLALLVLPNSFGARLRADVLGLILAGFGVLGVVYGTVRGNPAGWDSLEVIASLGLGAALLVAFVLWESRVAAPLLPLRLFTDRSFSVANIVGFTFSFGVFGSIFILIQYMQIVQGFSPLEAGVRTMPWTMAPMVIAPLAGLISSRVGTRALIVSGLSFLATAMFLLASTMTSDTEYLTMLPAFILAGIGMGLVFAPMSTAVLANITSNDQAKASGTNATLREVGIALGIAVLTATFLGNDGQLTPAGYVDAAIPAIFVGAGALAVSAMIALALPSGRSPRSQGDMQQPAQA
ncbi:MAG: DHA2 family efflux MFS transporter permease subunit [Rhodoglobus sp.]